MLKTIWRKWAWKMFLTSTFLTNFTIFEASNRILAQEFLFLHENWNVQLIWKPRCNYPNMQSMSINTYKFLFDQYLSDFIFKASSMMTVDGISFHGLLFHGIFCFWVLIFFQTKKSLHKYSANNPNENEVPNKVDWKCWHKMESSTNILKWKKTMMKFYT